GDGTRDRHRRGAEGVSCHRRRGGGGQSPALQVVSKQDRPPTYLMAPQRMLFWCMASAPVMCCHGKEIVGDVVMGFYDVAALGSLLWALLSGTALVNSGRLVNTPHPAGWPPIITWLWRIPWMLWLLAAISFVVLRLQYPVGGDITISPNVPLMENILQV